MNPLFVSSGYAEPEVVTLASGGALDLSTLPAFLRVLLTTDGTVTKSIESYFWEPVRVVTVEQKRTQLSEEFTSLKKKPGDELLVREVQLVGERSERIYAHAHSYVCPEALPAEMCSDLELGKVGIGELLRECGLETYRELMHLDKEEHDGAVSISRTYRIVMAHAPIIHITEKFPLAVYL